MLNIGPLEFLVLAAVALIVFGPEKLPQLTKDAARMLKTVRDMTQGAKNQLTSELGPEFADLDLASLNPRTAIQRALLGDGEPGADGATSLNPAEALRRAFRDEEPAGTTVTGGHTETPHSPAAAAEAPLAADERPPFDPDTT